MSYDVELKELPAQHIAVVRRRTSMASIGADITTAFETLGEATGRAGVGFAGPPFLTTLGRFDPEAMDIEVGFPVTLAFEGAGEVEGRELPAMTVASTLHRGSYSDIGAGYDAVQAWIEDQGREIAGPPREIYLTDRMPDPADQLTEIQFPVR